MPTKRPAFRVQLLYLRDRRAKTMLRLFNKAGKNLKHLSSFHVAETSPSFSNVASFVERARSSGDFMEERD